MGRKSNAQKEIEREVSEKSLVSRNNSLQFELDNVDVDIMKEMKAYGSCNHPGLFSKRTNLLVKIEDTAQGLKKLKATDSTMLKAADKIKTNA
ncbi:MAG: hypothetical protein FWD32_02695 [Firmicutes bacterium]|nr:hypothetical protein [Bacillota bacterium]